MLRCAFCLSSRPRECHLALQLGRVIPGDNATIYCCCTPTELILWERIRCLSVKLGGLVLQLQLLYRGNEKRFELCRLSKPYLLQVLGENHQLEISFSEVLEASGLLEGLVSQFLWNYSHTWLFFSSYYYREVNTSGKTRLLNWEEEGKQPHSFSMEKINRIFNKEMRSYFLAASLHAVPQNTVHMKGWLGHFQFFQENLLKKVLSPKKTLCRW